MSLASGLNLITSLLCLVLLLHCWRTYKALNRIRSSDFKRAIDAVQKATADADAVLRNIRSLLADCAEPKLKAIADADRVADELGVMIGIAEASANRLSELTRHKRLA